MGTNPMPWFPMYAMEMLGDSDFQMWSLEERGIWITLCARCWADGSIPDDIEKMARLCFCNAQAMLKHWPSIASKFSPHPLIAGRLISNRIEEERTKAILKAEKIRKRGQAGAAARWEKEKSEMLEHSLSNAYAMPKNGTSPSPSPSPISTPAACSQPELLTLEQELPLEKKTRKPKVTKPPSKAPGISDILAGSSAGEKLEEWFWHTAGAFPKDKNHKPREAALLYRQIFDSAGGDKKEHMKNIYLGAVAYRDAHLPPNKKEDQTQFMTSFLTWLQQEGWESALREGA